MPVHCLAAPSRCARRTLLAMLCLGLTGPLFANDTPNVLSQPATLSPQAEHAVLLGVTRAEERLVAVGERGVILLSDDNGKSWRQVQVPVSSTLTAVQFIDGQQGWAVGHAGVVLHSADGGESWKLQLNGHRAAEIEMKAARADQTNAQRLQAAELLVADGADKPFLSLHFSDHQHGMVAGAYGLALRTEDGGLSWQSMMGEISNGWGAHIYAISQRGAELYLAGEQGFAARSLDGGLSFERLEPSYEGSFFAQGLLPGGQLVLAGLRGTVLLSRDRGDSFEKLHNPIPISINSALASDGGLLLANQAGGLLRVTEDGGVVPLSTAGSPLADLVSAPNGQLVGVGFSGTVSLGPIDPATTQALAE